MDCIGQKHLGKEDFPFSALLRENVTNQAKLKFRNKRNGEELMKKGNKDVFEENGDIYLSVPGMDISDNFQFVNVDGIASDHLFLMAVPFMGGLNPDYSGLDFCENASNLIVEYMSKGSISSLEKHSNRQIKAEV